MVRILIIVILILLATTQVLRLFRELTRERDTTLTSVSRSITETQALKLHLDPFWKRPLPIGSLGLYATDRDAGDLCFRKPKNQHEIIDGPVSSILNFKFQVASPVFVPNILEGFLSIGPNFDFDG